MIKNAVLPAGVRLCILSLSGILISQVPGTDKPAFELPDSIDKT